MRTWIACLFVCTIASPAAAQTRVRLEVEVTSWLDPTPFEALKEFVAKLTDANIQVVDSPEVPLLRLAYAEISGAPAYWPKLVPTTNISFTIRIETSNDNIFEKTARVPQSLAPPGDNFPSAAELRLRAIDDFRREQRFRLLGHIVGSVLGNEASFRPLLSAEQPDMTYALMLLARVSWSPSNDDLFVRAFRSIPVQLSKFQTASAEDYLRRNLPAIQETTSGVAPVLAILMLEDYGESSAARVLRDLGAHPLFGTAARKALTAVEGRQRP
jgi:hypothetical protein